LDRFTDIDICLIGAPRASFQAVRGIGNFAFLNEGQTVYTLANPAGLDFTFANGIISALRSNMTVVTEFNQIQTDMIQTTAPISGGLIGWRVGRCLR
jgi:S1-C subfamily serine protease